MEGGDRAGKVGAGRQLQPVGDVPQAWLVIAPTVGSDSASGNELSGMW